MHTKKITLHRLRSFNPFHSSHGRKLQIDISSLKMLDLKRLKRIRKAAYQSGRRFRKALNPTGE